MTEYKVNIRMKIVLWCIFVLALSSTITMFNNEYYDKLIWGVPGVIFFSLFVFVAHHFRVLTDEDKITFYIPLLGLKIQEKRYEDIKFVVKEQSLIFGTFYHLLSSKTKPNNMTIPSGIFENQDLLIRQITQNAKNAEIDPKINIKH